MTYLLSLLLLEYIGDFLLQSRYIALNKSKNLKVLGFHGLAIFLCLSIPAFWLGGSVIYLAGAYTLIHCVQDWYIWNLYKYLLSKRFKKEKIGYSFKTRAYLFELNKEYAEDKLFYDIIGLDRFLHIITLILLWNYFY